MPDEIEPTETNKKKCFICGDNLWGLFGVALGAVFLFIGIDVLRRSRIEKAVQAGDEGSEVVEDE